MKKLKAPFTSRLDDLFRIMEPQMAKTLEMSKRARRMRADATLMYERAKLMQDSKTLW
jgi:hypothetical protein